MLTIRSSILLRPTQQRSHMTSLPSLHAIVLREVRSIEDDIFRPSDVHRRTAASVDRGGRPIRRIAHAGANSSGRCPGLGHGQRAALSTTVSEHKPNGCSVARLKTEFCLERRIERLSSPAQSTSAHRNDFKGRSFLLLQRHSRGSLVEAKRSGVPEHCRAARSLRPSRTDSEPLLPSSTISGDSSAKVCSTRRFQPHIDNRETFNPVTLRQPN